MSEHFYDSQEGSDNPNSKLKDFFSRSSNPEDKSIRFFDLFHKPEGDFRLASTQAGMAIGGAFGLVSNVAQFLDIAAHSTLPQIAEHLGGDLIVDAASISIGGLMGYRLAKNSEQGIK
jgi:hypothetical protein